VIVSEEKKNSNLSLVEHRSERRILVHVPVEVTEMDGARNNTKERTFIEDVSDFGCRFSTRGQLHKGDTVALIILGPHGNILPDEAPRYYEIMWVAPKERGLTVGARLVQGEKLAILKSTPRNSSAKPDVK
jgi:hypothetical protein